MKGKFITFEGCEGVGKSKQIKMLCDYLEKHRIKYLLTREPGGTTISEKIREIILDSSNSKMTAECEALLYASARAQLLNEVISKALKEGQLVICDRYIDSSFAYQASARGLGYDFVEKINAYAIENFMPDKTIFLNLSPKEAFKRKGGADTGDRVEMAGIEFHEKVYQGYLYLAEKYKERIINIDASGERMETHNKIISSLKSADIL